MRLFSLEQLRIKVIKVTKFLVRMRNAKQRKDLKRSFNTVYSKMTKKQPGPTQGFRLKEVSVL